MAQKQKYRVLFLRSYSKICMFSLVAHGLNQSQGIEFMQYPPFPESVRPKLRKLSYADQAWHDFNTNLVTSHQELLEKLSSGYFDCVLLTDHNAELTRYNRMSRWEKLKLWGKTFRGNNSRAAAEYQYATSFPFSLTDICQYAPLAVIDLDDYPYLRSETLESLQLGRAYFKREIPYNRFVLFHDLVPPDSLRQAQKDESLLALIPKIHGIPLGIPDQKFQELTALRAEPQDIDVFWAGRVSSTMRAKTTEFLKKFAAETSWNIVLPAERMPYLEFCQMIARSKITLSIEGGGWDCDRHYEALALGSLPVMNRPAVDAVWWHDMPEEVFFENNFSDFESRLEALLTNEPLRQQCLQHVEQRIRNHTLWSKIIEYIVDTTMSAPLDTSQQNASENVI